MKIKTILLTAAVLLYQFAGFTQTNPIVKYLPDDASVVMSINMQQLGQKISGESFRQSFMYREMMKNPSPELNAFFDDPAALGLDLSKDVFLVAITDTSSEYPGMSVHFFGSLKDESLFTSTMKRLAGEKDPVQTYGTNKILSAGKGAPMLAWNDEVFVLSVLSGRSSMRKEILSIVQDSTRTDPEKRFEEVMAMVMKIQRDLCFELLTPHPQNALSRNSYFMNLINTAGDIKMWSNGTPNPALNKIFPGVDLAGKLQAFTGKNKTSVISFKDGMITSNSRNYPGETIARLYSKYPTAHQDTNLVRRLPKGKILGLFNISYHGEMAHEFMQQDMMKELAENLKKIIPFDFSEVNAAFKNNMLLAVVKADEIAPGDSITQKMNGLQFVLAMPIADKEKFLQLKNEGSLLFDSLKNSETGSKLFKDFNPVTLFNDSLFVMSLSRETAAAFLNNNGTNTVPGCLGSNMDHPMVMNINMKEIMALVLSASHNKLGTEEKLLLDIFDQMTMYGGEYVDGALNSNMEFRFSNPDVNALKQLFDMINAIAEQSENKRSKARMEDNENFNEKKFTPPVIIREEVKEPPPPPKKPVTKPKPKTKGY